jgi:hypothetical protein
MRQATAHEMAKLPLFVAKTRDLALFVIFEAQKGA